jgi:hypothetical protein
MAKSPTWNLEGISRKCSSYWGSALFLGLPFTFLYRGIDYLIFCITTQSSRFAYLWSATLKWDIFLLFVVSFIWWGLMRQLVAWKRKYYAENQTPGSGH